MMNMMDRMVEGRAHQREIDMLLELTYVNIFTVRQMHRLRYCLVNKLKVRLSAP